MENDEFKKDIEELFRLFNKLMERYPEENMPGIDKAQFEQLKLFLRNYENMKDQISMQMMGPVNEPMRQMLRMFIKQMKEELGEDDFLREAEQDEIPVKRQTMPVEKGDPIEQIAHIDAMLSRPGLKNEEIDRLLDERARLGELLKETND
ncbi:MAG: hypothetical protein RBR84_03500 [Bacteroidales bacterium]|jgi:hypothetical protein|nr:hypothetical protein [Bacteroidales bacterium]MDD4087778.1 hypothetical protein [Bacteroidales bacterium]MDY0084965.1 hypothetical protein [Bacteroidales bacterium]